MKEIAQRYLRELGIVNTQYAITKHTDKAHLHMHIIANMVNNDRKAISDSWIGLKGKKVAQHLTKEYGLIPALEKNLQMTNLEALSQSEATKYQVYIAISENLPKCRTMEELEIRLLKLGIEMQFKYKGQTNKKQGVSFKKDNVCFKGSQVDRKFSLAGLEKALDLQRKQEITLLQKPNTTEDPVQKPGNQNISQANIPGKNEKNLNADLSKGREKTIDILLKPEHTNAQTPLDFFQQRGRKRKKKSKGISR